MARRRRRGGLRYRRVGGVWSHSEHQKITADDGQAGDRFGSSVSISGNRLVLGSPGDDDNGADTGAGLVFGVFHKGLLSFLASPVREALEGLVKGLLLALLAPIAFIFGLLNQAFPSRPFDPSKIATDNIYLLPTPEGFRFPTSTEAGEAIERAQRDWEFLNSLLSALTNALILFVAMLVLYLVWRSAQIALGKLGGEGERESVSEEVEMMSHLVGLLSQLVPDFMRRLRRARGGYNLPDGPPGVVNALRLYYELLTAAEQNDVRRRPQDTPTEFQPMPWTVFSRRLVRTATHAFNRGLYGHHPTGG